MIEDLGGGAVALRPMAVAVVDVEVFMSDSLLLVMRSEERPQQAMC